MSNESNQGLKQKVFEYEAESKRLHKSGKGDSWTLKMRQERAEVLKKHLDKERP